MREFDTAGLFLCDLQGKVLEKSTILEGVSSEVFIRRFVYSKTAKLFDDTTILYTSLPSEDVVEMVEEEYQNAKYGTAMFNTEELYWIGYFYRYFSYVYEKSTKYMYKIIKPKELRILYPAYHALSVAQAIERVLEAKGIDLSEENELQRQLEIYKRIRAEYEERRKKEVIGK